MIDRVSLVTVAVTLSPSVFWYVNTVPGTNSRNGFLMVVVKSAGFRDEPSGRSLPSATI